MERVRIRGILRVPRLGRPEVHPENWFWLRGREMTVFVVSGEEPPGSSRFSGLLRDRMACCPQRILTVEKFSVICHKTL